MHYTPCLTRPRFQKLEREREKRKKRCRPSTMPLEQRTFATNVLRSNQRRIDTKILAQRVRFGGKKNRALEGRFSLRGWGEKMEFLLRGHLESDEGGSRKTFATKNQLWEGDPKAPRSTMIGKTTQRNVQDEYFREGQ